MLWILHFVQDDDGGKKIAVSPTAPRKDNVGLVLRWKIAASPTAPRDDSGFSIIIVGVYPDKEAAHCVTCVTAPKV